MLKWIFFIYELILSLIVFYIIQIVYQNYKKKTKYVLNVKKDYFFLCQSVVAYTWHSFDLFTVYVD